MPRTRRPGRVSSRGGIRGPAAARSELGLELGGGGGGGREGRRGGGGGGGGGSGRGRGGRI